MIISTQTTITQLGLQAIAEMRGKITRISAYAGTGTSSTPLIEQTKLVEVKQELVVIEDGVIGDKRWFRLQLSNSALTYGYTLNQIGVFISIDDSPVFLYLISQIEPGYEIPGNSVFPGFLAEHTLPVRFSAEMDYDAPPSTTGVITPDALDARINALREELNKRIVFSASPPVGDGWTIWLQDLGEIEGFPEDDEPEQFTVTFNTAPLDTPGEFAFMFEDGNGERVLNMTDDPESAGENDIIIDEQ